MGDERQSSKTKKLHDVYRAVGRKRGEYVRVRGARSRHNAKEGSETAEETRTPFALFPAWAFVPSDGHAGEHQAWWRV